MFSLFSQYLVLPLPTTTMSYKAGIVEIISELKDRTGSSMIAIKKAMQAKLPKDKKWQNATFLQALKNGVASGDFVQLKSSYKLSPEFKKKATKVASTAAADKPKSVPKKKVTAKKATATKAPTKPKKKAATTTAPKKKVTAKKATAPKKTTVAKKSAPKKAAAAKPAVKKTAPKKKATATKKAAPPKKKAAATKKAAPKKAAAVAKE
jgi:histone H1/5